MGTTHYDRRRATCAIGEALRDKGWTLYGYGADKSDSMTDYFHPAHWDGVAERDGVTLCVDLSEWRLRDRQNGGEPVYGPGKVECHTCSGTGKRVHARLPSVVTSIVGGVVKRDPGAPAGAPCEPCKETGTLTRQVEVGRKPWPAHMRVCSGRWAAIRQADGRVLGTGQRPLAAGAWNDSEARAAVQSCVAAIEAAARKAKERSAASTGAASQNGTPTLAAQPTAEIRPGRRAGVVEVAFAAKPDRSVLDALKAAGFRWAASSACWYGPAGALPESVGRRAL